MIVSRSSVTSDASDALSVMLETRLPSRVSRSSDGLTLFRAIGEALSIMINLYISVRCHNISLSPVFKRLLRMTDMSDARQMFSASPPLASPLALAHTFHATAKSVDGFGDSKLNRRVAPDRRFFIGRSILYGGLRGETARSAGALLGRFANPAYVRHHPFGDGSGGLQVSLTGVRS